MHSSSTFSIPVVVPSGTVFQYKNGRRPRGRGGRVGRVWRTTVVNRTHSVNSYVAVLHALYASGLPPRPRVAPAWRVRSTAAVVVPVRRCRFGLRARALL
jgi:hypothetical protein